MSNEIIWILCEQYRHVFTFLKTFKYKFVDCKQSKNKYVFSFSFSLLSALSYVPLLNLYNVNHNNNCLFVYKQQYLFVILLTQFV